jgi:hypothetical protein
LFCTHLERGSITSRPLSQEVRFNDTAQFTCVGVGSFEINILWQYDQLCSNRSSCEGAIDIIDQNVTNGTRSQINSTLTINISMLQPQPTKPEFTIKCILQQIIPPEINLQGDNQSFVARLEIPSIPVITTGKCMCVPGALPVFS